MGRTAKTKSLPRFPAECPAFLVLDKRGFFGPAVADGGEIAEGTFNDQGNGLMLGFVRGEHWWGQGSHRTPFFLGEADPDQGWQCAWHYTGRLVPLTRAAREMLACVR
jgi:hypothetical protein